MMWFTLIVTNFEQFEHKQLQVNLFQKNWQCERKKYIYVKTLWRLVGDQGESPPSAQDSWDLTSATQNVGL